jgi:hypothetical protein
MVSALSDLELEKLTVIYPGEKAYQLAEKIYVMPMTALATSQAESIIGG